MIFDSIRQARNVCVTSPTKFYFNQVARFIRNETVSLAREITIFDYGCGPASPVQQIRHHKTLSGLPIRWLGGDIHPPAVESSQKKNIHDQCVLIRYPDLKNVPNCDIILLLDVVEHLPKNEGSQLLEMLEKKTKCMVVYTPNGFLHQQGTSENPFQEHKAGWSVQDFYDRGYQIIGCGGWLFIQQQFYDKKNKTKVWTQNVKSPKYCFSILRSFSAWLPRILLAKCPRCATFLLAHKVNAVSK